MLDSSHALHSDRKSHHGFSVHMKNHSESCISVSKNSTLLALYSTEVEYNGMYEASKLIMWLRQFLLKLGFSRTSPTPLHEDNKCTILIANDKCRTKHMDVRCHLIRDSVKSVIIQIQYQPTESMVADILTKPLDAKFLGHLV